MSHGALASVAWVPEYIDRLGVSFATWGTIIGFSVIGSITPLLFASRLLMRFGSRPLIRFANYAGMVFLVALAWTNDPALWMQISINIIGRMHACWSLGAVGAAITGAISTTFLSLELFLILVAIATIIIFEFTLRWLLSPEEDGHVEERAGVVKRKFYQMPSQLWFLAIGLFAGIYPEVAVIDWAAVFARDVLNVDVALRSIPFGVFMIGMIIGRLSMTRLAEKYHPHTIASRGAFLAAAALALVALSASAISSSNTILGLVTASILWGLAGLGLAPASPAFFSAAGHIPGVSTAWAVSRLSLFNSSVAIGAKAGMGALTEGVGLSTAFFFPVILALISGVIADQWAKRARRSELNAAAPPTGPMSVIVAPDEDR